MPFSPESRYRHWHSGILNTKWIRLQHASPLITIHYRRELIMAEHASNTLPDLLTVSSILK